MKTTEIRTIVETILGYTGNDYTAWPGYYTTSTNAKVKAVWVEGSQVTPKDWKITGLECVIMEMPQVESSGLVGGGIFYERTWEVKLRHFGSGSLVPYIEKMQRHFGNSRVRIFKGNDITPMGANFLIPDPDWTTSYLYGGTNNHANFL